MSDKKQEGTAKKEPTYLDKEKALIEAIVADQKKPEDERLFDSVDQGIGMLSSSLAHFPDYVSQVVHYAQKMPIVYATMEGQDLRDAVTDLDRSRKVCHDAAIAGLNVLNRISDRLGLGPFAEVDTNNRTAVADFCGKYVNETYLQGIGGNMDAMVSKGRTYDSRDTSRRLRELNAKFGHIGQEAGVDGTQYGG